MTRCAAPLGEGGRAGALVWADNAAANALLFLFKLFLYLLENDAIYLYDYL